MINNKLCHQLLCVHPEIHSKTQIKDHYPDIYVKILKLERDYNFCSVKDTFEHEHKIKENNDKCRKNLIKFKEELNSILEEIRYRNRIN